MKRIAVEEHYSTEEHRPLRKINYKTRPTTDNVKADAELASFAHSRAPYSYVREQTVLYDFGARIEEMDKTGIDMEVLSLVTPGVQNLDAGMGTEKAREFNDGLVKIINKYPGRFAGFATLAPQNPAGAASELKRAINDLGLKGCLMGSNTQDEYLDDRKYWPMLEMFEKLDVPLYIHPCRPGASMAKAYEAYPGMSSAVIGFGAETHYHALRLMYGGVFDNFPKLKIILGHMGETFPYLIWRIDNHWLRFPACAKLKKTPSEYMRDNFWITTSGMFYQPALVCAHLSFGAEKIMFAVDVPFETADEAVKFMDAAPIAEPDREKIYHGNAEKLLKL